MAEGRRPDGEQVAFVCVTPFTRIQCAWYGRVVDDGKAAVRPSADRYVAALDG
ncbi:MAG TPA: hypothetical protein VGF10_12720 [Gaiella sp.]